ncbi:MAG: prepilin peptidase [Magnetovibrio sp.]|nr:prepilin peptidase [Magnetovibrio sp.]
MGFLHSGLMAAFIGLVLYAAWSDARELRIPNKLSLALLVLFFPTALIAGIGMEQMAWHLIAGVALLVLGFVLFALGLFGGGDAKLMSACALWLGWDQIGHFALWVVIIGGVLSLLVILLRKGLGMWPNWLVSRAQGLFEPGKSVPYGIAISIGALIQVPRSAAWPQNWSTAIEFIIG